VLMFVRVDVCVVSRACCDNRVEMLHLRRDAASEKDVCVCMYMCTCVYIHISILAYMYTFRHMNMYTYICTYEI